MIVATIIAALIPAALAWISKVIVDLVVQTISGRFTLEEGIWATVPYVLLEFALFSVSSVLNEGLMLLRRILTSRLRYTLTTALMLQAIDLDLHYFENPAYYDRLQNARREIEFRSLTLLQTSFQIAQSLITLISVLAILVTFNPLIVLLLFCATTPSLIAQLRYSDKYVFMLSSRASEFRRMNYLEQLLTVDTSAKEIKVFGLGKPLIERYHRLFWEYYNDDTDLARRRGFQMVMWGMVTTASYYGAYGWIVLRALSRAITLGDMTLYLLLFRQAQDSIQSFFSHLGELYEGGRFLENIFDFLSIQPQMSNVHNPRPVPSPIRQGIEFRNVSFRYPNRKKWVLRNINLYIGPQEKLALVGINGAGKTTLVKLLARLYDPTEGQILLDGVDLREYDLEDLRRNIGVIFQDFVRYQTTARENIGFGHIDYLDDEERIVSAARRGGADEMISSLARGYDTLLGNWFEGGQELSGGQWQKVALSRAFMRDSAVLVLDEPTAALDAQREFEIFERFRELTQGKMALLISHRFSTVRMADRIVVLEDGGLREEGTHEELLQLDGKYAALFNKQAAGYR